MKLAKFRPLDSAGVAHVAMIALAVVVGVAGFGAYQVKKSSADTGTYSEQLTACQNDHVGHATEIARCQAKVQQVKAAEKGSDKQKLTALTALCDTYNRNVGDKQRHCGDCKKNFIQKGHYTCTAVAGTSAANIKLGVPPAAPLLTKPAAMSNEQWTSYNPHYNMSFAKQAQLYSAGITALNTVKNLKAGNGSVSAGNGKTYNQDNWMDYLKYVTSGRTSTVVPAWMDSSKTNDNFMTYNPKVKFLTAVTNNCRTANGVSTLIDPFPAQAGVSYSVLGGFNPNYFSSLAQQTAWVKKYRVTVDGSYYTKQKPGDTAYYCGVTNANWVTFNVLYNLGPQQGGALKFADGRLGGTGPGPFNRYQP